MRLSLRATSRARTARRRIGVFGLQNRGELGRILSGGDDRILRGVIALIEEAGFTVVGAQDIAPGLLAPAGCQTKARPNDAALADIG